MTIDKLNHCRTCLTENPYLFLPMGKHPPANMFLRPEEVSTEQPAFSLNPQVCLNCGLIQILNQIPSDFFRHYLYVPSGSDWMHVHFIELAKVLDEYAGSGLIVDVGCNDGLLLAAANKNGSRTLGIDPAENIAKIAAERGVDVHIAYFNVQTAEEIKQKYGSAKVIVTTNTFHHIEDLHAFMEGIEILLDEEGVFIVEVPWAKKILEFNQFDNIYHEHVSEFTVLSILKLGDFFDFDIVNVNKLQVHGGSMRVLMRRKSNCITSASIVSEMINDERVAGLLGRDTYDTFTERIEDLKTHLLKVLWDLKTQDLKIAGYGAPAKGNTLLNFFDIGIETLDYLVDRNPLKHGLYSPGKKIPIYGPQVIKENPPDVLLVLAWNFFDEIRNQQAEFEKKGGKFLLPLPTPNLIGG